MERDLFVFLSSIKNAQRDTWRDPRRRGWRLATRKRAALTKVAPLNPFLSSRMENLFDRRFRGGHVACDEGERRRDTWQGLRGGESRKRGAVVPRCMCVARISRRRRRERGRGAASRGRDTWRGFEGFEKTKRGGWVFKVMVTLRALGEGEWCVFAVGLVAERDTSGISHVLRW